VLAWVIDHLTIVYCCLLQVEDYTETGQTLDLLTAPEDRIDFSQFTPERYSSLCMY